MPEQVVNGVRLHYEEHGAGAPIALIHGCGGSGLPTPSRGWRSKGA